MKAYQHELAHHYQQRKNVFRFASASLFQSLITAAVIGIVVAFIGVALNAVRWQGNTSWYVSATTGAVAEMGYRYRPGDDGHRRATQASDPTNSGTRSAVRVYRRNINLHRSS